MLLPPEAQERLLLAKTKAKASLTGELSRAIDQLFESALSKDYPPPGSNHRLSTTIYFDVNIDLGQPPGVDVFTSLSMIPHQPEMWHFDKKPAEKEGADATTTANNNENSIEADLPVSSAAGNSEKPSDREPEKEKETEKERYQGDMFASTVEQEQRTLEEADKVPSNNKQVPEKSEDAKSMVDYERQSWVEVEPKETPEERTLIATEYVNPVSVAYINCTQPTCLKTVPSLTNLNIHLSEIHRIMEHRCPLSGCKFHSNKLNKWLSHRSSEHGHLTSWKCGHCWKNFPGPHELSLHCEMVHLSGRYECGMKSKGCDFWAKYSQIVKEHFKEKHCSIKRPSVGGDTAEEAPVLKKQKTEQPSGHSSTETLIDAQLKSIRDSAKETDTIPVVTAPCHLRSPSPPKWVIDNSPTADLIADWLSEEARHYEPAVMKKSTKASTSSTQTTIVRCPSEDEATEVVDADHSDKYSIVGIKCLIDACTEYFVNNDKLNKHLAMLHDLRPIVCRLCGDSFGDRLQLNKHIESAHGTVTDWKCSKCDQVLHSHGKLALHYWLNHHEGYFKCADERCRKVLKKRADIMAHFEEMHSQRKA